MLVFEGKSIQAATKKGLKELHVTAAEVEVTVISAGKRGFLGMFGASLAMVELKLVHTDPVNVDPAPQPPVAAPAARESTGTDAGKQEDPRELKRRAERDKANQAATKQVRAYLATVITALGIDDVTVTDRRVGKEVWFQIDAAQEALVIGKHGKNLNALQVLAQMLFDRHGRSRWTVMLNVGDYRQRREQSLVRLAQRTAREVLATGKAVYLDPMPNYERKVVHEELKHNQYAQSRSDGVEPRRYVVVVPRQRHSY